MRRGSIKYFFTIVCLAFVTFSFAQGIDEIGEAIGSGSVNTISKHLDNAVSLTISGSQSTYSKAQAEMILRDFFTKNSPKSFSVNHSGTNSNTKYIIGTLTTTNGNYRTYYAVKQSNGTYLIQEIRFEK